ncbi:uncharacterized protein [Zea mays]|uniref:uncharacterized protein n=2 Tax=Zea mays TaxID=4577 RepID=UPI0009AA3EE5|nr:uncharacterized protein LOC103651815 [Zea mays]|eukprot:XP_020406261.1 uncharacterized protein LOC103651815 [Zea mays]
MEHNDSGPVFDQTPTPHVDTLKGTTNSGSDPPLTEQECIRSLWDLICSKDIDQSRVVIDYGDYSANCMDIYESFAEGKCLEDVFMQCFIECVRDDSKNHRRTLTSNRLILDVNVGALLNFEEQERHSKNPQPFDQNVLQNCLHNTLPALVNLDKCKSIMVPMLSRGHWTLYVINLHHRVIHILDSNPYGIQLGGTEWKDYHYDPIYLGGRKFPWARVIMSRLSKALQHVCPNAEFPKFGNFPLDMPSNCPTMRTGSNDCGFFVMSYMKSYDHNAGVISSFNQPDNSRDLRAHALHQLTFHRINKALPLPLDIQRFMFARN